MTRTQQYYQDKAKAFLEGWDSTHSLPFLMGLFTYGEVKEKDERIAELEKSLEERDTGMYGMMGCTGEPEFDVKEWIIESMQISNDVMLQDDTRIIFKKLRDFNDKWLSILSSQPTEAVEPTPEERMLAKLTNEWQHFDLTDDEALLDQIYMEGKIERNVLSNAQQPKVFTYRLKQVEPTNEAKVLAVLTDEWLWWGEIASMFPNVKGIDAILFTLWQVGKIEKASDSWYYRLKREQSPEPAKEPVDKCEIPNITDELQCEDCALVHSRHQRIDIPIELGWTISECPNCKGHSYKNLTLYNQTKQPVEQPDNLLGLEGRQFVAYINDKYRLGYFGYTVHETQMVLIYEDKYFPVEATLQSTLKGNNIHYFQLLPNEGKEEAKPTDTLLDGAAEISKERQEQIKKHGYDYGHDNKINDNQQLSLAALMLLSVDYEEGIDPKSYPDGWDEDICDKMIRKPRKERLIIAGALIAAEIDRLNYRAGILPKEEAKEESQPDKEFRLSEAINALRQHNEAETFMDIESMRKDINTYFQLTKNLVAAFDKSMASKGISFTLKAAIKKAGEYRFSIPRRDLSAGDDRVQLLNHIQAIVEASQGLPVEPTYAVPNELMDAIYTVTSLLMPAIEESPEWVAAYNLKTIAANYPTFKVLTPQAKAVIDAAVTYSTAEGSSLTANWELLKQSVKAYKESTK